MVAPLAAAVIPPASEFHEVFSRKPKPNLKTLAESLSAFSVPLLPNTGFQRSTAGTGESRYPLFVC
jgi:hypothetical protein